MITEQAPKGSILTYTGKFVNPLEVNPKEIDILDIAHATSNLCRYNGHVNFFYSVAQHSVLVAQTFPYNSYLRRWALLHDASEAYLGDVVAPLKHNGHYEFYLEAEKNLMNAVCDKFKIDKEEPPEVKEIDLAIRGAEMRDLKNYMPNEVDSRFGTIKSWLPESAKTIFLAEANNLGIF